MRLVFLLLITACTFNNKSNPANNNKMDNKTFKLITLSYEEINGDNITVRYYIDHKYVGENEKGFANAMDTLALYSDLQELVIESNLTLSTNSESFAESLPFYNYEIGYKQLLAYCKTKGIAIKYKFL